MYRLYYKKIISIVTGVTGLLRAFSLPRNSVYALPHNTFRPPVTAVTGFCTRAHARKNSINLFLLNYRAIELFPAREVYPVTPVTPVTTIDLKQYFYWYTRNNPVTIEGIPVTMINK